VDYKDDEEWHRWNQDAKRRIMKNELTEDNTLPSHVWGFKHSMERVENMSSITGLTSKSAHTKACESTAGFTSPSTTLAHVNQSKVPAENNFIRNNQRNEKTTESSAHTKASESTAAFTSPSTTLAHVYQGKVPAENNFIGNTQTNEKTTESSSFVEVAPGVGVTEEMCFENEIPISGVVSESSSDNTIPSISIMTNQQTKEVQKSRVR
jgi:hypothetical protein